MATDMWTMINRELAKIEKARGGASDTPYLDVVSDTFKYAERDRERQRLRREERSEDAMQIMAATAGDYETTYDNTFIDRDIKRLENFVAKKKGKLDATAMDYYDLTLNKMRDQKALNLDFSQKEADLPGKIAEINDYLAKRDKDKVWTAENINELKSMQAPLAKFLGNFKAKHGRRLASKAYGDYNLQLNNMKSMNSFLLQSALDDGFLDEQETTSYMLDLQEGNTEASDRYKKLEDVKLSSQIEALTSKMGDQMAKVDLFKKFKKGDISITTDGMGNYDPEGTIPMTWEDLSLDAQGNPLPQDQIDKIHGKWDAKIRESIAALNITDKSYQTVTVEGSYVDAVAPELTDYEVKKKELPKKVKGFDQYAEKITKGTIAKEFKELKDKEITPSKINEIQQKHGISLAKSTVDQLTVKGLKGREKDSWNRLADILTGLRYFGTRNIDEIEKRVSRKIDNYVNKGKPKKAQALISAFEDYKSSKSGLKDYYKNKKK